MPIHTTIVTAGVTAAHQASRLPLLVPVFHATARSAASAQTAAVRSGLLNAANVCQLTKAGGVLFTGQVCNRGLRGVAANMPATFYLGGGDAGPVGMELCRTTTQEPVPVGGCRPVTCEIPRGAVPDNSTITMIVNDAGGGAPGMNRITDECKYDNNTAVTMVGMCAPPPK